MASADIAAEFSSPVFTIREITVRPGSDIPPARIDKLDIGSAGAAVLSGPSGSGKSTLFRALARLTPAERGDVQLDGSDWKTIHPRRWRRMVAFVPSSPTFLPGSVRENLELPFLLGIGADDRWDAAEAGRLLERLGLGSKFLDRDAAVLSDGERARLGIVRALLMKPRVLLADEPSAPLDDDSAAKLAELLHDWAAETGGAIFLIAHDSRIAEPLGARRIDLETA